MPDFVVMNQLTYLLQVFIAIENVEIDKTLQAVSHIKQTLSKVDSAAHIDQLVKAFKVKSVEKEFSVF